MDRTRLTQAFYALARRSQTATAKALGLTIPPSLLQRADEVIGDYHGPSEPS